MKKCPFCAEEIQDEAVKCKHCGERLGTQAQKKGRPILVVGGLGVFLFAVWWIVSLDAPPNSAQSPRMEHHQTVDLQKAKDDGATAGRAGVESYAKEHSMESLTKGLLTTDAVHKRLHELVVEVADEKKPGLVRSMGTEAAEAYYIAFIEAAEKRAYELFQAEEEELAKHENAKQEAIAKFDADVKKRVTADEKRARTKKLKEFAVKARGVLNQVETAMTRVRSQWKSNSYGNVGANGLPSDDDNGMGDLTASTWAFKIEFQDKEKPMAAIAILLDEAANELKEASKERDSSKFSAAQGHWVAAREAIARLQ